MSKVEIMKKVRVEICDICKEEMHYEDARYDSEHYSVMIVYNNHTLDLHQACIGRLVKQKTDARLYD